MKFDRNKAITPFDLENVRERDWGWFSDCPIILESIVGDNAKLKQLIHCMLGAYPFMVEGGNSFMFFYPAPYEIQQEKWVEEHNLKVGNKVKVIRKWKTGEKGFLLRFDDKTPIGKEVVIDHILEDCIVSGCIGFPYFAIEKVAEPTYAERQAEWVKENDLKIGDKVKVVRYWKNGEQGFRYTGGRHIPLGRLVTVSVIEDDCIAVWKDEEYPYFLPYFAIEKVEAEYRPFANAKEFEPCCEDWWVHRESNRILKATGYDWEGVWIGQTYYTYDHFHLLLEHRDTGEPAGVKLC